MKMKWLGFFKYNNCKRWSYFKLFASACKRYEICTSCYYLSYMLYRMLCRSQTLTLKMFEQTDNSPPQLLEWYICFNTPASAQALITHQMSKTENIGTALVLWLPFSFLHGIQAQCIIPIFNIPDIFYSPVDPLPAQSSLPIWRYFPSVSLQYKVNARLSEFPCKDRIFLWNPIYLDKQKKWRSSTKRRKMMLICYMEKSPCWELWDFIIWEHFSSAKIYCRVFKYNTQTVQAGLVERQENNRVGSSTVRKIQRR